MAWGYKLWEWQAETKLNRAQAMAHFLHRGIREGYLEEHTMNKSKKKPGGKDLKGLLRTMGIG